MKVPTHARSLSYWLAGADAASPRTSPVTSTVVAGWTGRDAASMQRHIDELAALGVPRPPRTPLYYRVSCSRLTQASAIEVRGTASSGEVECVLLQDGDGLCVGVGSDHTDREVETYDVGVSKQICDKPVARTFWPFVDVRDHWDELILRSWIGGDGERTLYQEGTVAALLKPSDLIAGFTRGHTCLPEGTVMFGGTLPVLGGVRPAAEITMELCDPVRDRRITHCYRCVMLPRE